MNKQDQYQTIFEEYQRLKEIYKFDCKTEIIRKMLNNNATKREINRIESILLRRFGITGDKFQVQEALENEVIELWKKYRRENNYSIRQVSKIISNNLKVDEKRIINLLYRNGYFGNFAQSKGAKKVAIRQKTGRKVQERKVENDLQAWSGLFKDPIMQFSPAWCGKNIQAT